MSKTRVYYNSACPVCDAGIKHQKQKLQDNEDIEWIDVHENNEAAKDVGDDLEFVRERLHVVDETGELHVGSEAFAELWEKTPGQGRLARITRAPVLRVFFRGLYNAFAALLYRWNRWLKHW